MSTRKWTTEKIWEVCRSLEIMPGVATAFILAGSCRASTATCATSFSTFKNTFYGPQAEHVSPSQSQPNPTYFWKRSYQQIQGRLKRLFFRAFTGRRGNYLYFKRHFLKACGFWNVFGTSLPRCFHCVLLIYKVHDVKKKSSILCFFDFTEQILILS